MAFVSLSVREICDPQFNNKSYWSTELLGYKLRKLKKDDTYLSIFNIPDGDRGQQVQLDFLINHPDVNIIFQGVKAVNKNPGHTTKPRNVVVIYELKDGKVSKV